MTVTLELKPEIESRVNEKAKSRGLTIETFLVEVIEEKCSRRTTCCSDAKTQNIASFDIQY